MLRVLVVHNRYRSAQPSGEDRVVDQEVAVLGRAGHRVALFERRSDAVASMSLLDRTLLPIQVPWNGRVRLELTARLRAERPDVVHIHNTFPLLSPSVVAACADVGVPVVVTLHNYSTVCPSGTLYRAGRVCADCTGRKLPLPALWHGCYRGSRIATVPLALSMVAKQRQWWSSVDRFICISQAQCHTLVQAGMPAERLILKHNFIIEPDICRTGVGEYVLYLGRMTEEKGVRLLMASWDLIAKAGGIGIPLALAGNGPLEAEVTEWARDRDDVVYHGLKNKQECEHLVARAAVLVAPSEWMETFGLTVVEAMAAAVPVVASGHGAFVELVDDEVTGLLHRPGDAESLANCLRRVVSDSDHNMALGRAGRGRYESRFTPKIGLTALVEAYASTIRGVAHDETP